MHKSTFILTLLVLLSGLTHRCIAQSDYLIINSPSPALTVVDLKSKTIWCLPNTYDQFSVDFDNNKIPDFTFSVSSHIGTGEQGGYARVNGYDSCTFISQVGLVYSFYSGLYDTIPSTIPKISNSLDTLFPDNCKISSADFSSYWSRDYNYIRSKNEWVSGIHFLGFKKTLNNKVYLGWFKLELISAREIVFYEYAIQTIPVGIDELKQASVSIFPNPATDEFKITDVQFKKLDIYNTVGRLVLTQEKNSNNVVTSVDVRNLVPGVYFIKVTEVGNENYFIKKFIKQ